MMMAAKVTQADDAAVAPSPPPEPSTVQLQQIDHVSSASSRAANDMHNVTIHHSAPEQVNTPSPDHAHEAAASAANGASPSAEPVVVRLHAGAFPTDDLIDAHHTPTVGTPRSNGPPPPSALKSMPSRSRTLRAAPSSAAAGGGGGGGDGGGKAPISYHINDAVEIASRLFCTNFITTSKYTLVTFLPLNLFNQFQRLANQYFLLVVVLQAIPGVSPLPLYTSLAPLIFILVIGALNDGREDVQRHKSDAIANNRPCTLLQSSGEEVPITSAVVEVGQILRIDDGQEFPADLILLHTARDDGTCYVNTANLDGEAAPKIRSASGATQTAYNTPEKLVRDLRGRVQYEQPNASLYRFQGNILLPDPTSRVDVLHPLGDKQLLLRGARLVNTQYIYGLVVYTGVETKMMLNRNPARFKFSHFELMLNSCVIVCLLLNLVICLVPSLFYVFTNLDFSKFWDINHSSGEGWFLGFLTLYILFSFMVPQSLYVTIELVKVGQALFMEWDNEMGYTDPETGEYSRCQVKASALNEELGVVDVICTDKTGTLTSNQMDLSRCSVGGALFFENDAHRDSHAVSHPQTQAHRQKHGAHKLMTELVHAAMAGWIRGTDEQGTIVFDEERDFEAKQGKNIFIASDEHAAEEERKETPSSKRPRPTQRRLARDFLLNILLCNAVLPSWKAKEKKKEEPAESKDGEVAGAKRSSPDGSDDTFSALESRPLKDDDAESDRANQRLVFESQSPDEIALLQALQRVGLTLSQRSGDKLSIDMVLSSSTDAQSTSPLLPAPTSAVVLSPLIGSTLPGGQRKATLTYTVLAQLEFASAWRRNSVIVRAPDGSITLYTKGADTTIAELVDTADARQQAMLQLVMQQATQFAGSGSRTLVFACRPLSAEEYAAWYPMFDAAQNAFHDRDAQIERAFAAIETGMQLLGCSAVDDQLQEHVAETVDFLLGAQLQIIVLTGDKLETAVTIAKESHLIPKGSHVLYAAGLTSEEVGARLAAILVEVDALKEAHHRPLVRMPSRKRSGTLSSLDTGSVGDRGRTFSVDEEPPHEFANGHAAGNGHGMARQSPSKHTLPHEASTSLAHVRPIAAANTSGSENTPLGFALAIDGVALELALLYHRPLFMQIFGIVETVVSYRSTPMQKALVVKLMKETGKVCLAIGDGANDVSMIQESHVGIGILGKEGAHAAMSSDFVLRRFWHLRRLLCVHGRYNFFRTAQVVMFSFFKNLAFPLPLFWFCFWSLANGTSAFDSLLVTCFNTFFTSLPPFFAGLFDRDVREDVLMASPQAYAAFKVQSPFTRRTFVYTLVSATYQSAVTYFFAFGMMWPNDILGPDGKPADLAVLGNVMITSVVITTNLSMLLAHSTVNYINFIAVGVGLLLFLIVFVFESVHYWVSLAPDGYGMGLPIFGMGSSWLYFLLTTVACLLPNAVIECWWKLYYPQYFQLLQHVPPEAALRQQALLAAAAATSPKEDDSVMRTSSDADVDGPPAPSVEPASSPSARRMPLPGGVSLSGRAPRGSIELTQFKMPGVTSTGTPAQVPIEQPDTPVEGMSVLPAPCV